jgi:hypothetical protein
MRNYTGLAVWGCLFACLALEFIDFDGGKADVEPKADLFSEPVPQGSRFPLADESNPRLRHSGNPGAPAAQAFAR